MSNRRKSAKTSYWQRESYRQACCCWGITPRSQPTYVQMRWMRLVSAFGAAFVAKEADVVQQRVRVHDELWGHAMGQDIGEVFGWSHAMPLNQIIQHIDQTLVREQ